jgi:hypothetical protein
MSSRRNRVDPWGDLHAVATRGGFTGNRGCLVDDHGALVRHHNGSLWITCRLEFKDYRQPLAAPHRWTPLFFLDEAVALAAGHRPCGYCRREQYMSYRQAVTDASGSPRPVLAVELNQRLARERLRRGRGLDRGVDRRLGHHRLGDVSPGAVVIEPRTSAPHLVHAGGLRPFRFDGWGALSGLGDDVLVEVLTPPTSLSALAHGFVPELHPSAAGESAETVGDQLGVGSE